MVISTQLLVLVSMILHMLTFIMLGLGSVYENQLLTAGSLITLMIGLFFGKLTLERLPLEDIEETPQEDDSNDDLFV